MNSESLLTPFSGSMHLIFLIQLRICIKQTFRFLTAKCSILRNFLQIHLKILRKYLCRLHNFCINEVCLLTNTDETQDIGPVLVPSNISVTIIEGNSVLQDILVAELAHHSL